MHAIITAGINSQNSKAMTKINIKCTFNPMRTYCREQYANILYRYPESFIGLLFHPSLIYKQKYRILKVQKHFIYR